MRRGGGANRDEAGGLTPAFPRAYLVCMAKKRTTTRAEASAAASALCSFRNSRLTAEQRREQAKRAINARWARVRAAKAAAEENQTAAEEKA